MKHPISTVTLSCLLFFSLFFVSCVPQENETDIDPPATQPSSTEKVEKQSQLPVRYQQPSYKVTTGSDESLNEVTEEVAIKVGASIRSTQGPQPLWDILKRLAALKKMNVSWASDVDQNVLVDVDINAEDDFYDAVDNLLRQVDYYHEMKGSTIVVKYKETRQFHVAMPFTKSVFETATGGNVLGSNEEASNIEGTIKIDSRENNFDVWQNIQDNMNAILDTWSTVAATEDTSDEKDKSDKTDKEKDSTAKATRQVSSSGNKYTIDKPIGLITVHAPRPLLDKLEVYFNNLKKELYKQVSIEAKIIEVQLEDSSEIGLDWNTILSNLTLYDAGYSYYEGQSKNYTTSSSNSSSSTRTYNSTDTRTGVTDYTLLPNDRVTTDSRSTSTVYGLADTLTSAASGTADMAKVITNAGAAAVSLASFTFDKFLNAVQEQGQATILSNPKISVLNGQPSLITVGRNVTYIDSIESDVDHDTGTISYTVNTERVLSGVGMALTANILDDDQIILNLVPVTSELEEPIEYRDVGLGTVGLPVINVREMSTTVKVRDGEMLVIGGLINNVDEDNGTFVPGTRKLGFFKYLFGYEEKISRKRELIILLKPRIIN